jgi:hypothetical protein
LLWAYCIGVALFPFFGWGGYAADGLLITCGYDFISQVYSPTLHILSPKKKKLEIANKQFFSIRIGTDSPTSFSPSSSTICSLSAGSSFSTTGYYILGFFSIAL